MHKDLEQISGVLTENDVEKFYSTEKTNYFVFYNHSSVDCTIVFNAGKSKKVGLRIVWYKLIAKPKYPGSNN